MKTNENGHYNALQELKEKFKKQAVAYCAEADIGDYFEQLFWDHLPSIAEKVFEGYGIDMNNGN